MNDGPVLTGEGWVRILDRSIPSPQPGAADDESDIGQFVAASYARKPVRTIWARSPQRRRIVWAADHPSVMPLGATHGRFDAAALEPLSWVRCSVGIHDVGESTASSGLSLEDVAEAVEGSGIAWMVAAEPLPSLEVPEWAALSKVASHGAKGSTADQVTSERARRILEYIERVAPRGIWRLVLHCGANDIATARALLGHLMSTSGVLDLPALLSIEDGAFPLVDSSVVAAFGRAPRAERAGYRIEERAQWDTTPEVRGPVRLGAVLDIGGRDVGRMSISTEAINRHVFVTGATGSGKSETVRRILEDLTASGIPWLVIEPAKAEYHSLASLIHPAEVDVLRPGDPSSAPVTLNPLVPTSIVQPDGQLRAFPLPTHISLVRSLFEAAFEGQEPFPQILAAALERCYQRFGWNIALSEPGGGRFEPLRYPNLGDLRNAALAIVDELGYGSEVRDNVRGFVDVRINSLRQGAAGRFFESGHPIDLQAVMRRNVVLQIEDLGNERDQAFLMGTVLMRWVQMLRLLGHSDGALKHVIVLEEAHRLLRASSEESSSAIEQFANLLAEVRSYGQGVIVAEQIPSKIVTDVIKNSGTKIVHRLPALDDRESVGATMNLDESQSAAVLSLPPGVAAVHSTGMDRPILVAVTPPPAPGTESVTSDVPHGRRSQTCSVDCQESACDLPTLELARSLTREDSFRAWIDFVVLAHLVGEDPPAPPGSQLALWRRRVQTRRVLRCAVGMAVDESMATRMEHIVLSYSPDDLGPFVAESAFRAILDGSFSEENRTHWQVGEFRWRDVVRTLLDADSGEVVPPPVVAGWEHRGLTLNAAVAAEQLVEVRAIHRSLKTPYWPTVLGQPSILVAVADSRRLESPAAVGDWLELGCPWVPGLLSAEPSEGQS